MTDTPLTPKQELFAHKYLETGNASEAYRLSYAAGNMKPASVHRSAAALLANPKIASRLADLKGRQLKRHEVTVDRVLAEYGKLAFLDIRKAFDGDGKLKAIHDLDDDTAAAISGLEVETRVTPGGDGQGHNRLHKIKLSDKRAALDSLAKHLGMFVERTETKHTLEALTDDQLAAQLERLAARAGVRLAPGRDGPA